MEQERFINANDTYAIVGASENQAKYGNIVLRDLQNAGFRVIPVNPRGGTIAGLPVYAHLQEIPETPDVAVVVVPPHIGITILQDAKKAGIHKLWFQPGAESEEIRTYAATHGLDVMADGSCIMVSRRVLHGKPTHDAPRTHI